MIAPPFLRLPLVFHIFVLFNRKGGGVFSTIRFIGRHILDGGPKEGNRSRVDCADVVDGRKVGKVIEIGTDSTPFVFVSVFEYGFWAHVMATVGSGYRFCCMADGTGVGGK